MGIDFTPILGMMALGWVQQLLFDFGYYDHSRDNFKLEMANNLDLGKAQTLEQARDIEDMEAFRGSVDVDMLDDLKSTAQLESKFGRYEEEIGETFDEDDFVDPNADVDADVEDLEDLMGAVTENVEYNIEENVRGNDDF